MNTWLHKEPMWRSKCATKIVHLTLHDPEGNEIGPVNE